MKSFFLIKTKSDNNYIHNSIKKTTLSISDELYVLLKQLKSVQQIKDYVKQLSRKDYVSNKLQFLVEIGVFDNQNYNDYIALPSFKKDDIKRNFILSPHIVFETTGKCNLDCHYCAFSEYYQEKYTSKSNKNFDVNLAIDLLIYNLSESEKLNIYSKTISFYGGEPLLNISFIEEVVAFLKRKYSQFEFKFTFTTNGLLLEKYIDFLVLNDFNVYISIDGDSFNNSYRLLQNGKESFDKIYKNILEIKEKHPDFFKENISFLSVLHNRNSIKEIQSFFIDKLNTTKFSFSELSTDFINPKLKDDFYKIYKNIYDSVDSNKDYWNIKDKVKFTESDVVRFIFNEVSTVKRNTFSLLNSDNRKMLPTGTCLPFSKSIYITTNGDVYFCERINHKYKIGKITKDKISINYELAAKRINTNYQKIISLCSTCYRLFNCNQCMYKLDIESESIDCKGKMNYKEYQSYITFVLDYFEKHNDLYDNIIDNYSIAM